MTQFFERHLRLVKKDQELQRLFEAASKRRKLILQKEQNSNNENDLSTDNCGFLLLRPLRSTESLIKKDNNDNKIKIAPRLICDNTNKSYAYHSYQHLPETHLDSEEFPLINTSHNNTNNHNNINNNQEVFLKSVDNVSKVGYHNSSFAASSSSSDEIDTSNYCQFFPATSSSNNTTSSSHFSRNFQNNNKNLDDLKSCGGVLSETEIDNNYNRRSSILFYPSGSPLISHKYQGSPVVRIDNKIRAGEVDYLVDAPKVPYGKPPVVPRRQALCKNAINSVVSSDRHLSQPNLEHINEDTQPSTSFSPSNSSNIQSTIIRRTKKKMLEEHMRKRFSTGDYSTRSLIEWENNLNVNYLQQLSISGDLTSKSKFLNRQLSCEPNTSLSMADELKQMTIVHNYTSEINILHYSSTESFKDTQVSFSLKNPSIESKDKNKRSGFIQRSLNDIVTAFKNATASEKTPGSRKVLFTSNKSFHFKSHKMERKRGSITSDFLYSVPPFARRHLPPDISGAAKIISQDTYQTSNLPSSTPNLIAELDPTFHERNVSNENAAEMHQIRHPNSKRNRSYRLSFIENAHTVTTKKLTSTNLTSPSKTLVPRFVQPRRRTGGRNSGSTKQSRNLRMEPVSSRSANFRSHSSNRFSCIQQ